MHKFKPVPYSSMALNAAFLKGSWRTGAIFGRPIEGLKHGFGMSFKGQLPFIMLQGALGAATAEQGHAMSEGGRTLGSAIGTLIGGLMGGGAGMLAGGYLGEELAGTSLAKGIQAVADISKNYTTLNMGKGQFHDSEAAYTQRQVAAREMNSSILNARRYLGNEASLMHT